MTTVLDPPVPTTPTPEPSWYDLDETADLLDAAAAYIDAHGWTYAEWSNAAGAVCPVGAINAVTGNRLDHHRMDRADNLSCLGIGDLIDSARNRALTAFAATLDENLSDAIMTIVEWNDRHANSKAEVVRRLREAAAAHRSAAHPAPV